MNRRNAMILFIIVLLLFCGCSSRADTQQSGEEADGFVTSAQAFERIGADPAHIFAVIHISDDAYTLVDGYKMYFSKYQVV